MKKIIYKRILILFLAISIPTTVIYNDIRETKAEVVTLTVAGICLAFLAAYGISTYYITNDSSAYDDDYWNDLYNELEDEYTEARNNFIVLNGGKGNWDDEDGDGDKDEDDIPTWDKLTSAKNSIAFTGNALLCGYGIASKLYKRFDVKGKLKFASEKIQSLIDKFFGEDFVETDDIAIPVHNLDLFGMSGVKYYLGIHEDWLSRYPNSLFNAHVTGGPKIYNQIFDPSYHLFTVYAHNSDNGLDYMFAACRNELSTYKPDTYTIDDSKIIGSNPLTFNYDIHYSLWRSDNTTSTIMISSSGTDKFDLTRIFNTNDVSGFTDIKMYINPALTISIGTYTPPEITTYPSTSDDPEVIEIPDPTTYPIEVPDSAQIKELEDALNNPDADTDTKQDKIKDFMEQINPNLNPDTAVEPSPSPNPDDDKKPDNDKDNEEDTNKNPDGELGGFTADLKSLFPFCIPFDLIDLFNVLDAEPETPVWKIPIEIKFKNYINYKQTFKVDMSKFDSAIKILRTGEILFFILGLILVTRNLIKG